MKTKIGFEQKSYLAINICFYKAVCVFICSRTAMVQIFHPVLVKAQIRYLIKSLSNERPLLIDFKTTVKEINLFEYVE